MNRLYVKSIWVDGGRLFAETYSGVRASYDLSRFKEFRHATTAQMADFEVVDGKYVHWPQLEADINLEGMFFDNRLCPLTETEDTVLYAPVPETGDCVADDLKK